MDLGIQKKTALVMSSSRGLGEGIAKSLASEGVHVLLSGRNKDRLSEIVDEIEDAGGQADCVVADLVDPSSVNTIQLAARELLGQIDIFIANTGGHSRRDCGERCFNQFARDSSPSCSQSHKGFPRST